MNAKRKAIPTSVIQQVLHQAGYRCANPSCRTILTLQIHHLDQVSEGGQNTPENLLALCPNCHTLHHKKIIPLESLKTWKQLLLSLNEGFNRLAIDVLLAMNEMNELRVSGDGFIQIAGLLTGGYVQNSGITLTAAGSAYPGSYGLKLTEKGKAFIEAWKAGNHRKAIQQNTVA